MTSSYAVNRVDEYRNLLARHVKNKCCIDLVSVVDTREMTQVLSLNGGGPSGSVMPDSLIRIASMTKPIAAATTIALIERGLLGLDDPIERFIPELANRRVLRRVDAHLDDVEPARDSITVRHLLTCTMGFGFPMTKGPHPVMKEVSRLELGLGPPIPTIPHSPDEWIRKFASLPLMAHPGTAWMYDTSFTVLGLLISRAASTTLESALHENILGPCEMGNTGFHVPPEKLARFVPCYQGNSENSTPSLFDGTDSSPWARPPVFPNAAGGLVSTAEDFSKFSKMLLAKGLHRSRRVLAEASVDTMTTNHIAPEQRGPASAMFLESRGWGLGLSVALAPDGAWSRLGRYGWDGGLGTSWFNDTEAGVSAILMSQRFPPCFELFTDFWKGVSRTWCE